MTTALLLALVTGSGNLNGDAKKISCDEAMKIGRTFMRDCVGNGFELVSCGPYSVNNQPSDGWSVRFDGKDGVRQGLKLDFFGKPLWMEAESQHGEPPKVTRTNWKIEAIRKGHVLMTKLGLSKPVLDPDLKSILPNWFVFFSITEGGKPFFGSNVGYSFRLVGDSLDLISFHREDTVPAVNAQNPTINLGTATAAVNRAYPTDADFDKRSGTQAYRFNPATLGYYLPIGSKGPARLAWHFSGVQMSHGKFSNSGGSFETAVDAVTGQVIDMTYHPNGQK